MQARRDIRKQKKQNGTYTGKDAFWDILLAVPEVFLYAGRLLWWLIRGLIKLIAHAAN
ncbi:hypothetical protein [Ectobacillus ponti]|uniref:Uncharacterized protein n=1 Tax=Ectobacillus ponti TaxID=2961894 RepID=A0AA42BQQ7_9BACI|nr:hypothetical protein [Ectobacillus ponti]MCP8969641.1 hypothetical protein [Ectobacillus ponti]